MQLLLTWGMCYIKSIKFKFKFYNKTNNIYMVIPYTKGMSESFKRVCKKVGVQAYFKKGNSIKDLLVAPKDKDNNINKGVEIYRYKCKHLGCTVECIREKGRTFGDRYKEHLKASSSIYNHNNNRSHSNQEDNFSVMDRESQGVIRTIKEAMFIRGNVPPLNRNLVKYQLPHIWVGPPSAGGACTSYW